jgi:DNA polymerase (family 10)
MNEVVLLATGSPAEQERLLRAFTRLSMARAIVEQSTTLATISTDRGPVTLLAVSPTMLGSALVWYTGSRAHVNRLATIAVECGLRFHNGVLTTAGGSAIPCADETDLYEHLGLPFVAPELRENEGEVEAARSRQLPTLLTDAGVRGDLHMHSTWSDGRDTIEDMARASLALGYEYIAITDHSERAWSNRKLSRDDIAPQRAEIESIRRRYRSLEILHGIEVDIMKDGTLDFEDETLAAFDIVLASLHDHGGQSADELTKRYLRAVVSPLVDVITHPANRAPAQSDGYEVDFDRIFEAAARTNTAMEVDGAPGHLDMDGALARRAAAAGVTIVIDSDCHRAEWLGRQMRFGVGTARRGWIGPNQVLNTRSIDDVRAFVAQKRRRG